MAAIIAALDTTRMPTHIGENDHPEHTWNHSSHTLTDLQERFVQLFFQMVRVSEKGTARIKHLKDLSSIYLSLLQDTDTFLKTTHAADHDPILISDFKTNLTSLINHTRDCIKGKGERDLAYTLLLTKYEYDRDHVYDHDTEVPRYHLVQLVNFWCSGKRTHTPHEIPPPGSWKDILALCNFIREWCGGKVTDLTPEYNLIIRDLLRTMTYQINRDITCESPSLAAKWAPRESSKKQRWLFYRFTRAMFPDIGSPSKTPVTSPRFLSACKTIRMTLSSLNRKINTLEVKQCAKAWSTIDPKTIPSVALQKQKNALLNLPGSKIKGTSTSQVIRYDDPDRIQCALNLREYTEKAAKGEDGAKIKASRTSIYDLVRDAIAFNKDHSPDHDAMLLLEEQWLNNGKQIKASLPPMIPMVDTSGSMGCDNCTPLYYALGLGLRASEKTHPAFRNRILTFSKDPTWVRMNEPPSKSNPLHPGSFINRISDLSKADWGMNTDFFKAMEMILHTLLKHSVPPTRAKNLVLAVFSDMQIDQAASESSPIAMHTRISTMYNEHGYDPPHILYWNLRTTNGFPAVTTEKNVTMLSGFSPILLNVLQSKGIEALAEYTPYRMISELLDDTRFK